MRLDRPECAVYPLFGVAAVPSPAGNRAVLRCESASGPPLFVRRMPLSGRACLCGGAQARDLPRLALVYFTLWSAVVALMIVAAVVLAAFCADDHVWGAAGAPPPKRRPLNGPESYRP